MNRVYSSVSELRCEIEKHGLACAMYPVNEDGITLNDILVRHYIRDHLQNIPDSAFDSLWKQSMKDDEGEDWETEYNVDAQQDMMRVDRSMLGPILYMPQEKCFYVFLQGKVKHDYDDYWFSMKVPLIVPSGFDPKSAIKYLYDHYCVEEELERFLATYQETPLGNL